MKTKSKNILNWKLNWCDDKSGCWYSAKVPILGWEYIVEVEGWYDYENKKFIEYSEYIPMIFYSNLDDNCTYITKKDCYKHLDAAKAACERHLNSTIKKLKKLRDRLN